MIQVIRLADLEGESFLDAASVGLLPFIPLMKPPVGMNTEAWLQKCVEKTESAPVDTQKRGILLFALSTLGSLTYDANLFQKLILEEMMQESPFYELIIQRGIELGIEQGIGQGSRDTFVKNILTVFTRRFPLEDVQPVKKALESFQNLDQLSELHSIAIDIPSIEKFLRELETSKK